MFFIDNDHNSKKQFLCFEKIPTVLKIEKIEIENR